VVALTPIAKNATPAPTSVPADPVLRKNYACLGIAAYDAGRDPLIALTNPIIGEPIRPLR
jgi:hypothetical protein